MKITTAQFKKLLTDALEEPGEEKDGCTPLNGEFVCHDDIPDMTPDGFSAHFTACGEESETFLVCILKVDL